MTTPLPGKAAHPSRAPRGRAGLPWLTYRFRLVGMGLGGLSISAVLYENGVAWPVWGLLAFIAASAEGWRDYLNDDPEPANALIRRANPDMTAELLAQARDLAGRLGEWPIMALDDLASELDPGHRERVIGMLLDSGAQGFITGTDAPAGHDVGGDARARLFHVEQGRLRPA